MEKLTNDLIHATSPYLLQHATHPVHWVEWSEGAFERAEKEGKLVLISSGYAACHWCHVMAHESFESNKVADLMNRYYICIKVDREERPDVDQIYLDAVQLMTQQGGWPLNCFTLPNGKPIFGGTYFSKPQWLDILQRLWKTYQNKPEKVVEYAEKVIEGISTLSLIQPKETPAAFSENILLKGVQKWKTIFDFENGGTHGSPKFPLPTTIDFLLAYGTLYNDATVINHVHRTLQKMAMGGIYDQIGGGFSRYSTDANWKVPHFEKMLYDNAQLLTTYAHAYQQNASEEYRQVILQTLNWLMDEMKAENTAFHSSFDADSEGEEGKFYIWNEEELQSVLSLEDYNWVKLFYSVEEPEKWEGKGYILHRSQTLEEWSKKQQVPIEEVKTKLFFLQQQLLSARNKKIPPTLDNKQLTAWNAMTISGLVNAGKAISLSEPIEQGKKTAEWIISHQISSDKKTLYRIHESKKKVEGFLEDYAHTIAAFVDLFEHTFDEKWMHYARLLTNLAIDKFHDSNTGLFYYTSAKSTLIARKIEIMDNVIPSSNSVMAHNLLRIGKIEHNEEYVEAAKKMLSTVYELTTDYASGYANWLRLSLAFLKPYHEVIISGEDALKTVNNLGNHYLPNTCLIGGLEKESAYLAHHKFTEKSTIYICQNRVCFQPTQSIKEALNLIMES